ncbi:MAG: hypothetical protein AB7T38_07375 [Nitrospirales bacterium]
MDNTFFLKKVFPWFKKYIWPLIQEELIRFVKQFLDDLKKRYDEWARERNQYTQNAAKKAKEAEQKAASTTDRAKAEKYRTQAEVWRKVAEDLGSENEKLKNELDQMLKEASVSAGKKIKNLILESPGGEGENKILIGEREHVLPLTELDYDDQDKYDPPPSSQSGR